MGRYLLIGGRPIVFIPVDEFANPIVEIPPVDSSRGG